MPIKTKARNLANKVLRPAGLELRRVGSKRDRPVASCLDRLAHMKSLGFSPGVIFDCGAHVGLWTVAVSRLFPGSRFVVIEPLPGAVQRAKLNTANMQPEPLILQVAIGDDPDSAFLNVWGSDDRALGGSSVLTHVRGKPIDRIKVEVETLDRLSSEVGLVPDCVKLDLQGMELPALKGATEILDTTELFIIEFGCLDAYVGRTTPRDLMETMYNHDYCLYDVVDLIYRPYDGALTGGDFFFLKNSSSLRQHKGYA
jgi:FkbM family methyltransferase